MRCSRARLVPIGLAIAVGLGGCANPKPAAVLELQPAPLQGYLSKEALPDSLALLPPPPAAGSAAMALDEEVARRSVALHGTPRWAQATLDADLRFPGAADTFSCALGVAITEVSTPHLYLLLRRTLRDAASSTSSAKVHYKRPRPFVSNRAPICTPQDQAALETDGSYPSGHVVVGWTWALILIEIAPDRANALFLRATAFGENRNVCNVHWHSDVAQSRALASATVARLHAEPAFRADLERARSELAAVRAQGSPPTRDCVAEALATGK